MTDTLLTDQIRGIRRVRLFFSSALAAGAFTSTTYYAVTTPNGDGPSPINVLTAYAISTNPNAVELAVDEDFVPGILYQFTVTSVPMADTTTVTGSLQDRVGSTVQTATNAEPETTDIDLLLYGEDIFWNGVDFVEDPTGDLETIDGRDNWLGAMTRRFASYDLPWDPTYGPQADQFVDAPQPFQTPFAGRLLAQARLDDRTSKASVDVVVPQQLTEPAQFLFRVSIVGRDGLDPITISVPPPSSS